MWWVCTVHFYKVIEKQRSLAQQLNPAVLPQAAHFDHLVVLLFDEVLKFDVELVKRCVLTVVPACWHHK